MRFIRIGDSAGKVAATVAPEYGGMLVGLEVAGRPVLRLDQSLLSMAPMIAGGMPIMFPFPSRTAGDAYRVDGIEYYMPFHGLVKNAAFALREASPERAVLWIDGGMSQREANYPFSYRLELSYRIAGAVLDVEAAVHNLSKARMPHCLGWHPFFFASDRAGLEFEYHMRRRYDYVARVDGPAPARLDLSQPLDDVFFDPAAHEFTLLNRPDGYRAVCRYDSAHQALVICNTPERSVCIEPWCALPDSINSGRFLQWVEPGGVGRHRIAIEVAAL